MANLEAKASLIACLVSPAIRACQVASTNTVKWRPDRRESGISCAIVIRVVPSKGKGI